MVTTMFYHFFAPEGEHPTWEETFIEKKMQGPFLLVPQHYFFQQKQWYLFQKVQQIYTRLINMNTFP